MMAAGIASFDAACHAHPTEDCDVAVADRRLRARFGDPALVAPLMGAFHHRRLDGHSDPDLTILAWSTAPEPWMARLLGPIESAPHEAAAATFVAGDMTALVRAAPTPGIQAIDLRRRIALCWIARGHAVAPWERCRPFLPILHWWLTDGPWQFVHAGGVARAGGGILLAGKGGAGKSTTALACMRAGWRFAGDDFVPIAAAPEPRVEALYGSARLRPDMAAHFPELAGLRIAPGAIAGEDKHDYLLTSTASMSAFSGFPVRAIVLPRVTGARETSIRPVSRAEALRALAPSTLGVLKGDTSRAFDKIARFAAAVPCFRLELGTNLDLIPGAIARAIDLDAS